MVFKREAKIGDKWIELDDLEIRHVERCDGCSLIVAEDSVDVAKVIRFRLAVSSDTRDEISQMSAPLTTHETQACVMAAVAQRVTSWTSGMELIH